MGSIDALISLALMDEPRKEPMILVTVESRKRGNAVSDVTV
jgi:hypothetical protein